jgi:hypothetical protein
MCSDDVNAVADATVHSYIAHISIPILLEIAES